MSKTVDELTALFQAARGRGNVNRTEGDRAGIAAVVRALRDEFREEYGMWERFSLVLMTDRERGDIKFGNETLGSEAGEKVAEYTGGMNDLSVTPATDPAPAVCVWRVYSDGLVQPSCRPEFKDEGATRHRTICPSCKAPIKFTEAK